MKMDEFRIDDLITKLQEIRTEHGNLIVGTREIQSSCGDGCCYAEYFAEAETAQVRTETNDGQIGWIDYQPEKTLRKVVVVGGY